MSYPARAEGLVNSTFLNLKAFRHEERERHNLSMLTAFTSSVLNPTNARRPYRTKSSGRAQLWKSTFSFGRRHSTPAFFSNLSPRFRWVTSPKYPGPNSYLGFLFWHLWMTHPLRTCVNTSVNVAPNPCAWRKVLSLTKPKGKIYKTKSVCHYITSQL